RANLTAMDERMDEESPEDAPDPVQIDRIDENDDVLDEDEEFQMVVDRSREDEDPFVPAKRGFRQRFRVDDEYGVNRKKDESKSRKTPELRPATKSPVVAVKVHNGDAIRLDKLKGAYEANAFINRLEFIMESCPPLEKEAFIMLVTFLKETKRSAMKYGLLYAKAETKGWSKDPDVPPMDKDWHESMQSTAMARTDALLHELKKQKDEGVKESTRRAMEELLLHYSKTGQLNESFKQYNRGMREYCMQMKHIISMYTNWLETAVLLLEWHRVSPLIAQSERALQEADDAENQANAPGGRVGRNQYDQVEASRKTNRLLIATSRSKVNAVVGLSSMEAKNYKQACEKFLLVDADHLSDEWIVAPFDIARYGSLCALATLERSEMKAKCLDSKFRKMLESEPMLVEALTCYTRSQFIRFFELINSIQDALLLDPYFSSHVTRVYEMIKKRALAQYLQPFAVAHLGTMAAVFGMKEKELIREIISLVDKGVITGRLDEKEGIMEMKRPDERIKTHQLLVDTCDKLCARAEWTIMRALIQNGKILVYADESKQGRGKRRPNDENHHRDESAGSSGALRELGSGFRNVRSTMMRMVRGGGGGGGQTNEADSSAASLPIPIPTSTAMEAEPSEPHM
ncbi:hypothetical protein PFISCL1PPCAC_769, partial [Pristionchus fissidentatus]